MPPVIATIRRDIIYVPIIAAHILLNNMPSMAFLKNAYSKNSITFVFGLPVIPLSQILQEE